MEKQPAVNETGFTLLEAIFCLLIIMLLVVVAVPVMHKTYIESEIDQFFTVLDSDILFIQNQSLQGDNLRIHLFADHYTVRHGNKKLLYKRGYPETFIPQRFTEPRIEFTDTGTIKNPRGYLFSGKKNRKYQLMFPFGKGRHYIEEK